MATLTDNGIIIERLDQIILTLEQGFKKIYGQNINIAPDTPDGQMIGLIAQIRADYEELAEMVYKQLDPDLATGAWLEQRVAYAGLIRRQADYSYLRSVILTGDPHTEIHQLILSDPNKIRWQLIRPTQLNESGSVRADFRSELLGAYPVQSSTQLNIETVTLGLNNATTSTQSELGTEEETDIELRQRFVKSRAKNAKNSAEAIEGEISDLADVKQVVVLENNTGQTDRFGVEAHSLNVIVDGGDDNQIAQMIYNNKGAGVGLQGQQTVTFNRFGRQREIRFDRPTPVDVEIEMVLVRYEDFTEIDKDEIKRILTALQFKIGQSISLSRLYSPINTVGGFWVKTLKIAKKGQSRQAANIPIQPRELARILNGDIHIEVE
ncbi:baseplate J/gp47 family protein [Histophilus somni]|uniref:baseplate J/gp47 family protein n=1 Tax=Histophilus somni TaxID=731 RepID=UPI00201EB0AA|nr:baseplate J/gp47 family protein [Histophilus somni]